MRLSIIPTKNDKQYYVIREVYLEDIKKNKTFITEKLGLESKIRERLGGEDPQKWAKAYVAKLNRQEAENTREIIIRLKQDVLIEKDTEQTVNCGYLFLQDLYHRLGIHRIAESIQRKYKFVYNLDSILSRLVYCRILFPSSKKATYEHSKKFVEKPDFAAHDIYQSLDVIAKESDFIQAELYKNSVKMSKRNTGILYYDCTNYYFEKTVAEGNQQYTQNSKDHKPNPVVQMGLFMDGDGVPLAFDIYDGNANEQTTLKPLEKKIFEDFSLSRFVLCTDAGLSSDSNRKFNHVAGRSFVTVQSIKKLPEYMQKWALDPNGFRLEGSKQIYNVEAIDEEEHQHSIFYKEIIDHQDADLQQRLIVTYSVKYRDYLRAVRKGQIERARKDIEKNPKKAKKPRPNDPSRFIRNDHVTSTGEIADQVHRSMDNDTVEYEEKYDGYYAVCTDLKDPVAIIIKINKRRWMIEECFRIMKNEFLARPVFLIRPERIKAHFTTCFMALMVYRYLERMLEDKFTYCKIIDGLREMFLLIEHNVGYRPAYARNDFTDALHETFGYRTDYEIITKKVMKNILKMTKKK